MIKDYNRTMNEMIELSIQSCPKAVVLLMPSDRAKEVYLKVVSEIDLKQKRQ